MLLTLLTACQKANAPAQEGPDLAYPAEYDQQQVDASDAKPGDSPVSLEDRIVVEAPQPNQKVESPLLVKGEAQGTWFFEASFPVMLVDEGGSVLAQGLATSSESWMTEDFIPFEVTLEFETEAPEGVLVLQKDNPSGLAEMDEELRIPVKF